MPDASNRSETAARSTASPRRACRDFIGEANLIGYQASDSGEIRLAIRQEPISRTEKNLLPREWPCCAPSMCWCLMHRPRQRPVAMKSTALATDVVSAGSHTLVHYLIDGQPMVARTTGLPRADLIAGKSVRLGFNPEH